MKGPLNDVLSRSYVLPADVKVLPVVELADHVRQRIGGNDGEFAIARPGHRSPSRLVDRDTLELLKKFVTPTPIGQAIVDFARDRGLDPATVLEQAFPVLQAFTASLLLVPEGSAFATGVVATFVPGQMVQGYEVRRLVQVLQDTEVYFARGPDGGNVALKVARPAAVDVVRPMLMREADILRRLHNSCAPNLLEANLDGDRPFLALEWLAGVSANTRAHELRTTRGQGWRLALHRLVGQMMAAYSELHARGVVHADVHSGNILVDGADHVRVLDYGLARIVDPGSVHDHSIRTGLTGNMEPEAAAGLLHFGVSRPATHLGEQYMLASLSYTMICGEHYSGTSVTQEDMADRIVHAPPLPFARHGFESWPAAERVLRRSLSKDPADRYASVDTMGEAWAEAPPPRSLEQARRVDRESGHAKAFDRVVALALDPDTEPSSLFPTAPCASVQYGAAGLALFLYRSSLIRESAQLLAGADRWSRHALSIMASPEAFEAPQFSLTGSRLRTDSLYHSEFGVRVVHALISHARGDTRGVRVQCAHLADLLGAVAAEATRGPGELVLGSSGALLGATLVLEALDATHLVSTDQFREALEGATSAIWDRGLEEGRGHLGLAHGVAGVLYAQLAARKAMGTSVPQGMIESLRRLQARAEPRGRGASWPGTLASADVPEDQTQGTTPDHAPGWCAGTAGYVHLWTLAAEALDDGSFTSSATRAAWHTWEHGERAGHLCCGLSGRVFGLLRLYRHSGGPEWLDRARHLSKSSEAWLVESLASKEERPLGLYWGALGPLMAWIELEEPECAPMPLFGSEGWKSALS